MRFHEFFYLINKFTKFFRESNQYLEQIAHIL